MTYFSFLVKRYLQSKLIWLMVVLLIAGQVGIGLLLPKHEVRFGHDHFTSEWDFDLNYPYFQYASPEALEDEAYFNKVAKELMKKGDGPEAYDKAIEHIVAWLQLIIIAQTSINPVPKKDVQTVKDYIKKGGYYVFKVQKYPESFFNHPDIFYWYLGLLTYVDWLKQNHIEPMAHHEMNLSTAHLQITRVFHFVWLIGFGLALLMVQRASREREDRLLFIIQKQKKYWLFEQLMAVWLVTCIVLLISTIVSGLFFGWGNFNYPVLVNSTMKPVELHHFTLAERNVIGLGLENYNLLYKPSVFWPLWLVNLHLFVMSAIMNLVAILSTVLIGRLTKNVFLTGILSFLILFMALGWMNPTQGLLGEVNQSFYYLLVVLSISSMGLFGLNLLYHRIKAHF